jgi:hypothetical protein
MIEYLLKSSAVLAIFYVVYKVLLERETFFQSIRAYFLLGMVSALVLPLMEIKKYVNIPPHPSGSAKILVPATSETLPAQQFNLDQLLAWIYLAGLIFFAGRFLLQLASLILHLQRQPKRKEGKYQMIDPVEHKSPFSFFHYIVCPADRFDKVELEQVLAHEKTHADQLHSLDMLLSQAVCATLWFNPLAWLYQVEVEKNLEYIADSSPELTGYGRSSYEHLLLKTAQSNYQLALTSNFYQSLIKKRIKMLQKNRSNGLMYLKFAVIIPLMFAFVMNFNTRLVAQQTTPAPERVRIEEETEVITKDFSKSDLEGLKANLLKQGIEMKYRKLKYNDANEITGIELTVSNSRGDKARMSQSGDRAIDPISITFDRVNGTLALGNTKLLHEAPHAMHKTIQKEIHKEIVIDKDGDQEVIIVGGGGAPDIRHEDIDVKVIKDGNVWISESGDSTQVKHIKVIELEEDSEGVSKVIIKKGAPESEDIDVKITTLSSGPGDNEFLFIGEGDEQPLIIIDGKEFPEMDMKDIDHKNIETIEVLKGEKAVEQYGEKAKDGVVIIKTRQ